MQSIVRNGGGGVEHLKNIKKLSINYFYIKNNCIFAISFFEEEILSPQLVHT